MFWIKTYHHCWVFTLRYVCYILNHISTASLGGQVPLQVLYGVTPDISFMLLYTFYQPVFYATHDQHFPSESEEQAAFWVGFAEHCGDSLTNMVLDEDTLKIIYRSAIRPRTLKNPNQSLVGAGGEEDHHLILNPSNTQLHPQMVMNLLNQMSQLSSSNPGMMMVQHQASLCLSSIQMILLEGPSCYPLEIMGEIEGNSDQKSG